MAKHASVRDENSNRNISDDQWGRLITCLPQLDSIDLVAPSLTLGRSDECDVVIYKSKFLPEQLFFISKQHFTISKDPIDIYISYITDLSKNGTYVNGQLIGRFRKIVLQNNDVIAIGEKLEIYIYKCMNLSVPENFLPFTLRKKYVTSYLLGKGACGDVWLVYEKLTCMNYAIKKIVKGKDTQSQINNINHPSRIQTEINILQCLSHPLIVNTKEIVECDNEVFIVLEYIRGGELSQRISTNEMTEAQSKFFFYQIALAIQFLHHNNITHRDLKPGNILLSSNDLQTLIKVTDFGLSKVSEGYEMMQTVCGTWYYIAPEILNPTVSEYNDQVDVWSLGVILFYMLSKELPFKAEHKSVLGKLIVSGKYNMNKPAWYEVSQEAKDLVKRMLVVDPKRRITINEILQHSWVAKDHLMKFRVENLIMQWKEAFLITGKDEKYGNKRKGRRDDVLVTNELKRMKLTGER